MIKCPPWNQRGGLFSFSVNFPLRTAHKFFWIHVRWRRPCLDGVWFWGKAASRYFFWSRCFSLCVWASAVLALAMSLTTEHTVNPDRSQLWNIKDLEDSFTLDSSQILYQFIWIFFSLNTFPVNIVNICRKTFFYIFTPKYFRSFKSAASVLQTSSNFWSF